MTRNKNWRGRYAPLWLMGMTNAVFGMYGGILIISIPQILSARLVPESTIAALTAVAFSPGIWTCFVSPVLDVRFSRRWYSVVSAVLAATLLMLALLNLDHTNRVEVLLVAGYFFANLYQSALGGWLASITSADEHNRLSTWVTVGNFAGGGAMAAITGEVVLHLSPVKAAIVLGTIVLLPTLVFPWMPAPGVDRRLAKDSFTTFFGEVLRLLKRPQIGIAVVLFIAPAATFSLTNFLGGLGADFHASPHFVGLVGGAGGLLGGLFGCFMFRLIDGILPLRFLYLTIGVVGSLFTCALIPVAHTPASFAVALIGQNFFQALSLTVAVAIAFEIIGRSNPLAATTYCLMNAAFNLPITYMLFVDGWAYDRHGVAGSYAADAGLSLVASVVLGALLIAYTRSHSTTRTRH